MFGKYKQLAAGILIGSVVAGTGAVFADSSITAVLANSVGFKFDGVQKPLDSG